MLFDFVLNPRILLSLARRYAEPLAEALTDAVRVPRAGQWVTFLRNHDELDLSRLTDGQRAEVFAAFAPQERMRLYGRGIRRRLATMLGGDRQRIELAYALQFSLSGTPAIRYGEEIGMGEDFDLHGRDAFRTRRQRARPLPAAPTGRPCRRDQPRGELRPASLPRLNRSRHGYGRWDTVVVWHAD